MVQVLVCDHAPIDGLVNNGARVGGRAHVTGHVTCGAHIAGSDIVAADAAVSGRM